MHMCTLYCIYDACVHLYIKLFCTIVSVQIRESSEQLQQYLGIGPAINFCTFAPINFTQPRYSSLLYFFCTSTVFVFLPQNFVAFVCIGSSDVHHPESQPSI